VAGGLVSYTHDTRAVTRPRTCHNQSDFDFENFSSPTRKFRHRVTILITLVALYSHVNQ